MLADIFTTLFPPLLWTAALSSGLMAGIYFAFSVFVMTAFDRIPAANAVAAMNSINKVILRSLFMPLFFGSSLASIILIITGIGMWGKTGAVMILSAGVIYIAGMFLCTVFFNVPLNDRLARVDPNSAELQAEWQNYFRKWTLWNHVRTLASFATCTLCIYALTNLAPA